jgi:putative flippase GtrA
VSWNFLIIYGTPHAPRGKSGNDMGYFQNYWNSLKYLINSIFMLNFHNLSQRIFHSFEQIIKFFLVGVLNTVVGYGVFFISSLYINYLLALIFSHIVGVIHSFIWNKYWVFRSSKNKIREFLKFYSVYGVMLLINIAMLYYFVSILNISPQISQLIILHFLTILTYT